MNFEACGRTESEKTQKFVLRTVLRPNQIQFSHGLGRKRPKGDVRIESGLPPTADIEPQDRHVPFVPIGDITPS
jgi:hypothetical protein